MNRGDAVAVQRTVFDPEATRAMALAFDKTCDALGVRSEADPGMSIDRRHDHRFRGAWRARSGRALQIDSACLEGDGRVLSSAPRAHPPDGDGLHFIGVHVPRVRETR